MAWRHQMEAIVPPVVLGYVLLFLRHRYGDTDTYRSPAASLLYVLYLLLTVLFIATYLPGNPLVAALFLCLLLLVFLNNQFYLFLAAKRGKAFAVAAVPFHLLYHFYNGISFGAGLLRHLWRSIAVRAEPAPTRK